MKTTTKAVLGALLGLLTWTWAPMAAHAADPDSDSITIRITPTVDLGVDIDSGTLESGGVIDLGAINLYASTQTVKPATVTITGNYSSGGANTGQELDVTGSIVGGWSFDATPSTDSTLGALNELAAYALFTSATHSVPPTGDEFVNDDGDYVGGTVRAGGSGGAGGTRFEKTGTGAADMDDLSVGNQRHMWMFFRLPSQTGSTNAKDVTLTLTAVDAAS